MIFRVLTLDWERGIDFILGFVQWGLKCVWIIIVRKVQLVNGRKGGLWSLVDLQNSATNAGKFLLFTLSLFYLSCNVIRNLISQCYNFGVLTLMLLFWSKLIILGFEFDLSFLMSSYWVSQKFQPFFFSGVFKDFLQLRIYACLNLGLWMKYDDQTTHIWNCILKLKSKYEMLGFHPRTEIRGQRDTPVLNISKSWSMKVDVFAFWTQIHELSLTSFYLYLRRNVPISLSDVPFLFSLYLCIWTHDAVSCKWFS